MEDLKFDGTLSFLKVGFNIEKALPHPIIKVNSAQLELNHEAFVVSAFGDLPLYKAHGFEEKIKESLFHEEG